MLAGGIVALVREAYPKLTIQNCYAAGKVEVLRSGTAITSEKEGTKAGGLVASYKNKSTGTIKNCAALNSIISCIANDTNSSYPSAANRIAGFKYSSSPLENNIACVGTFTATTPTNTIAADGPGTAAGKPVTDLTQLDTWIGTGEGKLGWSEEIWDFSGISSGGLPVLK
jgi:hypothetical protein